MFVKKNSLQNQCIFEMNINFFNFRPIELRITGKRVTQFYEI